MLPREQRQHVKCIEEPSPPARTRGDALRPTSAATAAALRAGQLSTASRGRNTRTLLVRQLRAAPHLQHVRVMEEAISSSAVTAAVAVWSFPENLRPVRFKVRIVEARS